MSASGDATPLGLIEAARGRSLGEIARDGIGGWLLAVSVSAIAGLQTFVDLLLAVPELLIDVAVGSVENFILEPMGIVPAGADITAQQIEVFGFAALPVAVVIALVTFFIITVYLSREITSNVLPGFILDNRLIDVFFTSPEEEAQGED